jgi:hypothetical protein
MQSSCFLAENCCCFGEILVILQLYSSPGGGNASKYKLFWHLYRTCATSVGGQTFGNSRIIRVSELQLLTYLVRDRLL